jgi:hypothetical protein
MAVLTLRPAASSRARAWPRPSSQDSLQRERQARRREGLLREPHHDDRILAAGKQQRRTLELGRDPPRRQALRERLLANRPTSPLFNTEATARHVERAYLEMVQRQAAGLSPGPIDLRGG